jgi:hypothetical protein
MVVSHARVGKARRSPGETVPNTGFQRQLCLAIDAASYGRLDSVAQHDAQTLLAEVLGEAAASAGLDRARWLSQVQGDGELSLIPPDQPEPWVVDGFIRELDAVLRRQNFGRKPDACLRLRVALDFGEAYEAPMGFAGEAVVATARLLASQQLHQALTADTHLAVALSPLVYRTVVNRHTSIDPQLFTRVQVAEKEYRGEAWIRAFPSAAGRQVGDDSACPQPAAAATVAAAAAAAAAATGAAAAERPPDVPPHGLQNNFWGPVEAEVIGIKNLYGTGAGRG